jgi:hypothetical protein
VNHQFRVWDIKDKKFLKGKSGLYLQNNGKILSIGLEIYLKVGIDCVVQFLTGAPDESGVPIYDGDILRIPNPDYNPSEGESSHDIWQVKWGEYGWALYLAEEEYYFSDVFNHMEAEVIGNIFQTPELLA